MNSYLKRWIPPVVLTNARYAKAMLKFALYPHKALLRKNLELKGTGRGKRAFLIATGPSIKNENLKLLTGEDCFSLSNAFLHEDIQYIRPKFHSMGFFHAPMVLENYVDWLRIANTALPADTRIVLGHTAYDIVQKHNPFPGRKVYYLYLAGEAHSKAINLARPLLGPQTGPLLLLPLMIYMGYETIYLLGCDHTTIRDFRKTVTNFYRPDQEARKNATDSGTWSSSIETEYQANLKVIEQYKFYRDILPGTVANIVNLSSDSWLDVFPFDRLEHVLARSFPPHV
jgi:hypothetical protein